MALKKLSKEQIIEAAKIAEDNFEVYGFSVLLVSDKVICEVEMNNGVKKIIHLPEVAQQDGSLDLYESYVLENGPNATRFLKFDKVKTNRFATATYQFQGYEFKLVNESDIIMRLKKSVFINSEEKINV